MLEDFRDVDATALEETKATVRLVSLSMTYGFIVLYQKGWLLFTSHQFYSNVLSQTLCSLKEGPCFPPAVGICCCYLSTVWHVLNDYM